MSLVIRFLFRTDFTHQTATALLVVYFLHHASTSLTRKQILTSSRHVQYLRVIGTLDSAADRDTSSPGEVVY